MTVHAPADVYAIIKDRTWSRMTGADIDRYRKLGIATAIVLKESGGDDQRINPNDNGQGRSRGWWQFLERYWNADSTPAVPDSVALSPTLSTDAAFVVSRQFTNWQPWHSGGHDLAAEFAETDHARKSWTDGHAAMMADAAKSLPPALLTVLGQTSGQVAPRVEDSLGDMLGGGKIGTAVDAVVSPFAGLVGGLGRILAALTSATWWRRIGIGAAGVALIIGAVALANRNTIAKATPAGAAASALGK